MDQVRCRVKVESYPVRVARERRRWRCRGDHWGPHCWIGMAHDPIPCTSLRGWVRRRREAGVCVAPKVEG